MANPLPKPDTAQDGQAVDAIGASGYEDFETSPQEVQQRSQLDIEAALAGVIGRLQRLADNQVQAKQPIEQRWLEDLRQFHGRYDPTTEEALKKAQKSKLYVNLTRAKVNQWEARLSDLLFPTDDKNWGIRPVPAPHLSDAVKQSIKLVEQAAQQATEAHQGGNPDQGAAIAAQGQSAADAGASIQNEIDAADKSSDLMEQEIDSQLKESDYNIRTREALRCNIKLGTGIMKGPITNNRLKRSWVKQNANDNSASQSPFAAFRGRRDELASVFQPAPVPPSGSPNDPAMPGMPVGGAGTAYDQTQGAPQKPVNLDSQAAGTGYVLDMQPDPAPEFVCVDPWNYFPDMSSRTPGEAEFAFERHLWNNKQLREAVKESGLYPDAVAQLLTGKSAQPMPDYWAKLREITANSSIMGAELRHHIWEFTGCLEDEDLQALADATGDQTVMDFVRDNPLLSVPVIIWFSQGILLKFAPYPLDSCEPIYSVMPFEPDDTSQFGFGVPFLMRDSQSALNGAWRMMMDNGGLSVGPQIVVDQDMIKPAGDATDWTLRPMKVWLKSSSSITTKLPDSYKPFEAINITANQAQLQSIIALAKEFADEETSMPMIAAGGQDSHITKTTGGMSMLMNSANVVFRRVVKNFDDCISTPNIRRIYDWNMQFNKREDIKGNYCIDARGSSVLLVKEMQTQTLMSALMNFANHPVLGPGLKPFALLRKLFAAQMIRADEVVKSDDVIEAEAAERAKNAAPPQQGKSKEELDAMKAISQMDNEAKVKVADIQQQTALITLAQEHNMTLDDLQTKLQINRDNINHRERMFAAELGDQQAQKIGGAEFDGGAKP